MVTCERIAGVGSKCKGLDCPTTPCTGLSCKSLTKVNQTCQGVTSTGVKCLNGTGIIVPDGLDILINEFDSHGILLEKHMVENSIFICPDKVEEQMNDLKHLLRKLNQPNEPNEPNYYYIKKGKSKFDGNTKLPVRFSEDAVNVKYLDVAGNDLRPVITKKRIGNKVCKAQDVYTQIYPGAIPSGVVPVSPMSNYSGLPIIIDYDGNDFVRDAIHRYTGVWVCKNNKMNMLRNYVISHIWPSTADPFYFSSLWNVVIIPAHCNGIMDKNPKLHHLVAAIQNLFRAICYLLYNPNKYLADIENILKQNNLNVQIPRVEIPQSADLKKAQTCIDNGLIFI
uniref:hypothetical protein n=1 Tax=Candidatus Cryptobacteroides bacterium TaxID=3085639 RepID=UPI004024EDC2